MNLFYLFLLTLLNVLMATSMPAGPSQDEERNVDKDPVHGEWSSWETWDPCSQSCGEGVQRRKRSCTNSSPQHEGKYCPGDQFDRKNCNMDECDMEGHLPPSSSSPLEDMAIQSTTNTATTTTTKEPMLSLEEAIARFTQKFYLQMSRDPDNTGKNFVFSPVSLHTALTRLYEGTTEGSTSQKELEDSVFTSNGLKNEYKELERFYENVKTFKMANKMWMAEGFSLNDEYKNVTKDYFGAEIDNINFTNETAVENVNKWISEMTDNQIEELVEQFSPDTKLFLANVLHFKDSWKVAFKRTANDQMFTLTTEEGEKEEIRIPMMEHESSDNYQYGKIITESEKGGQFVKIPYKNENFEMHILMGDIDLDSIIEEENLFSNEKKKFYGNYYYDTINVVMPKFKIDSNVDAGKGLKEMGVKAVFEKAELGKMTGEAGIVVSDVAHRAVVEVDEEGTEAAAATAIEAVALSAPGERINFVVNKPFVFIIQDANNKIPILVGRVQDPRL